MLPIVVLTAIDAAARDRALFHLQLGFPGAVVVRHEITAIADSDAGLVRRITSDDSGWRDEQVTELEHSCLHCATRQDLVPALRAIIARHRHTACVLALPLSATPQPMLEELQDAIDAGLEARLCCHVAAVDPSRLLHDVYGDDLLAERGLELADSDDRSVGETVCAQVEPADVVVTVDPPEEQSRGLVELLADPAAERCWDLDQLTPHGLLLRTWRRDRAARRLHPLTAASFEGRDAPGLFTRELVSPRALHPQRLLERIEDLGTGALRGRGCFWLPTRPASMCAWDGAGGQLSIGDAGPWAGHERVTRLQFVSPDAAALERVEAAFRACLVTDLDAARGDWGTIDDGFDPWLGIYDLRSA